MKLRERLGIVGRAACGSAFRKAACGVAHVQGRWPFKAVGARRKFTGMPLPGKSFMIAGALALSGIVTGALTREPTPAPAASSPVMTRAVFAERFDLPDDFPLLKKQDRLKLVEAAPVPVQTETIATAKSDQPVEAKPVPKKKRETRVATSEHNACTRHHMRKVLSRHGRSWRCRK
jgi:hypothetical protein